MAVDLRVVDANSGKIILADHVEMDSNAGSSFNFGGGHHGNGGAGSSQTKGDPLGDIQRLTASEIAGIISLSINPVKIIAAQSDGTIILNYGNVLLEKGDYLRVYEVGEGFVDPDTGEVLGSEEIEIALLQVTEALLKFTKTKVVVGQSVAVGTLARKVKDDDVKALKKELKRQRKKRR